MSKQLKLTPAQSIVQRKWAAQMVTEHHYLHTQPDPRTRPFCYLVWIDGHVIPRGCLWFGRPESTRCYAGGLTYGSLADVASKRAAFDRWEVLNLSRVWFGSEVQPGGRLHGPDWLPGFIDRKGVWRSALASAAIAAALGTIGVDYLLAHPPCFLKQPYKIRAVLSYCNTALHKGTIYRASGFQLARCNKAGIETYWTPAVTPPSAMDDRRIRRASKTSPRSIRIRERSAASA